MDLPQIPVSQHAEIELIVFRRFSGKCALLDGRNKEGGGIPVIQLIDQITL
jgi:hypothetical protein